MLYDAKLRFWRWLIRKHIQGNKLPMALKITFAILFPSKFIYYQIGKHEGLQLHTLTWKIHGVEFSDTLFQNFRLDTDKKIRIISRSYLDGKIVVTVEDIKE